MMQKSGVNQYHGCLAIKNFKLAHKALKCLKELTLFFHNCVSNSQVYFSLVLPFSPSVFLMFSLW